MPNFPGNPVVSRTAAGAIGAPDPSPRPRPPEGRDRVGF